MRKYILPFLALLITSSAAIAGNKKEGHKLSFHIDGIKDTLIFLANYYGPKQYYKDTAEVDKDGNFVFEGDENLPGGIYSVVMPDKKSYFEFIVNDQEVFMSTAKDDLVNSMKVKNSEENKIFYEYLQFVNTKQKESKKIKDQLEENKENDKLKEQLKNIDEEVKNYKLKIMEDNPEFLVTKIFKASQDPEVPEAPILENGRKDSTFAYRYYKQHYLDGVDFSDDRLLRTPVFHNKLDYYIQKLVVQIPDSINKEAD